MLRVAKDLPRFTCVTKNELALALSTRAPSKSKAYKLVDEDNSFYRYVANSLLPA